MTILWDGRRLDSKEKVLEWLREIEAVRAEEAAATADGRILISLLTTSVG
ncbi:MAG: hypothetical protein ACRDZY_20335 [Acidimicrobiales bacterium]